MSPHRSKPHQTDFNTPLRMGTLGVCRRDVAELKKQARGRRPGVTMDNLAPLAPKTNGPHVKSSVGHVLGRFWSAWLPPARG